MKAKELKNLAKKLQEILNMPEKHIPLAIIYIFLVASGSGVLLYS